MSQTDPRCPWCLGDPLYKRYHDQEWGKPCYDPARLFEFLLLEGAQAGLSWLTILKRREGYRQAFCQFDPEKIAGFGPQDSARLMADSGIIRNRLKIQSAIGNAQAWIRLQEQGNARDFLWQFVDGQPIQNHWQTPEQVPVTTPIADRLSRALKQAGFSFVGSTICYAYMQAMGLVNDHLVSCPSHRCCGKPDAAPVY